MNAKGKSGKSKPKGKKSITKAQLVSELAAKTGLSKTQVGDVLNGLVGLVADELKMGNPVAVPGLVKISTAHKPATPARPGINPFTKEPMTFKAKPARTVVKVRAVKGLREMV